MKDPTVSYRVSQDLTKTILDIGYWVGFLHVPGMLTSYLKLRTKTDPPLSLQIATVGSSVNCKPN